MSVCCKCCMLLGRGLLRRADHSSRGVLPTVMRRCVWSRNLVNVEAMAHWGAVAPKTYKQTNKIFIGQTGSLCLIKYKDAANCWHYTAPVIYDWMRRPWPTGGCRAKTNKQTNMLLVVKYSSLLVSGFVKKDDHFKYCLHLCQSNYEPSFNKLSQVMQCHVSTSQ